jgi:hypothetical protein
MLRVANTGDGRVEFQMRVGWCVSLLLLWNVPLHAQEPSSNAQSALPWLQLEALSATRERPLFTPTRRKAAPPAPPIVPAVTREQVQISRKPQFVLTGIIAAPSEMIALLRDTATSESIAVRSGETIGRWRVLVNTDHSVTLQDASGEIELEIFAEP